MEANQLYFATSPDFPEKPHPLKGCSNVPRDVTFLFLRELNDIFGNLGLTKMSCRGNCVLGTATFRSSRERPAWLVLCPTLHHFLPRVQLHLFLNGISLPVFVHRSYLSSFSIAEIIPGESGVVAGSNLCTTLPLRSTRNFVKFHWMSPATAGFASFVR